MIHLLLAVIYLSFISLGLPDSLLGAAWPKMYLEFGVPVSSAGIISMIISMGTIISSLQSDRLTKKLGTGRVTAISVGITAAALFGFSISGSFWMLCLWAIPYGLGAGSVDASLNNYVALHYASYELAALYVGTGHIPWSLYYGICTYRWTALEHGIPLYFLPAVYADSNSGMQSSFMEKSGWKCSGAGRSFFRTTPPEKNTVYFRCKRSDARILLLLRH